VPPVTVMVLEYAVLMVAEDSEALIVNVGGAGAATTSERATDLVCAGLPASVIVAVKALVPVAVGVPESRPVAGASVIPAGRLPVVMDQVYGLVPPVACRTSEYAAFFVADGRVDVVIVKVGGAGVVTAIESATDLV